MNLVLLYGPPAVGKMTVGAQLSQLTGYPLFHNHLTVDLGLLFFPFGSAPFQRLVTGLRYQCVQAAAEAGAQGLIFTYVYGGGDDEQQRRPVEVDVRNANELHIRRFGNGIQIGAGHARGAEAGMPHGFARRRRTQRSNIKGNAKCRSSGGFEERTT